MSEPPRSTWTSRDTGLDYDTITQFDRSHLVMGVVGVLTAGVLVVAAKRVNRTPAEALARRIAAIVLGTMAAAYWAYMLHPTRVVLDETLPFHFTDVLRVAGPVALATSNEIAVCLTFYWGLVLNPMALLTPDAAWVVDPRIQQAAYWAFHVSALIVPLVMTFGFGYRPTFRGYRVTTALTLGWAAVAGAVNYVTGGNYSFLARPARGRSLIDVLGPWPWYIGSAGVLIAGAWAGMTWWSDRTGRGGATGPRGLVRRV